MPTIKNTLKFISLALLAISLVACNKTQDDKTIAHNKPTLKVGTIAGPETQLVVAAEQVADKKYGLDVQIVPFTDYNMPNEALSDGSIDVNVFQHAPYLQEAMAKRGYKLVAVGKTFVYPMGIYSKKVTQLDQLKQGAIIAIPNDPSNEARALLILETKGLIKLHPGSADQATPKDIIANPKQLQFKEIEAAQLPRSLPDVDAAAINTNYAMVAGLMPSRDALAIESANSPYANIIVVRQGNENDARITQFVDAMHSDEVKNEAKKLFSDQAIPAWK